MNGLKKKAENRVSNYQIGLEQISRSTVIPGQVKEDLIRQGITNEEQRNDSDSSEESDNIQVIINNTVDTKDKCTLISDSICKYMKLENTDIQYIRGLDSEQLLQLIESGQIDVRYKIVLIHIGTNDIYQTGSAQLVKNYTDIIKKIRRRNTSVTPVIGISSILPAPKFGDEWEKSRLNLNKLLRELAFRTNKVHFIPSDRRFLTLQNTPKLNLLARDRWHLSRIGTSVLAKYFLGTLGRLQGFTIP